MHLPVPLSLEPMEAEPVDELPAGPGWAYEPKYDGFRCIAFRDGAEVALQSRRQRPLARFFPEVAASVAALKAPRFVLDGELVILGAAFDTLQLRLHPAASRIAKLSRDHPATFIAFDLLVDVAGQSALDWPFAERRAALAGFFDHLEIIAAWRCRKAHSRQQRRVGGWMRQDRGWMVSSQNGSTCHIGPAGGRC
jgi:ATP-dependent DNA ligase